MSVSEYTFMILAVCQACFVLGISIYIFGYYMPKRKSDLKSNMKWHVMSVALSYCLLTCATAWSAAHGVYRWGNPWYWISSIGWILGDVSLAFVFRDAVRREKLKQLNNNKNGNSKN